ncbi:hypothetical protein GCM10020254_82200 [Streptomyces goshikiensis]
MKPYSDCEGPSRFGGLDTGRVLNGLPRRRREHGEVPSAGVLGLTDLRSQLCAPDLLATDVGGEGVQPGCSLPRLR